MSQKCDEPLRTNSDTRASSYGSCSENKELGVGFNFLISGLTFGFFGGTRRYETGLPVGGSTADTVIPYSWNSSFSEQDPYPARKIKSTVILRMSWVHGIVGRHGVCEGEAA